jgi:hypothetical protein
MEMSLQELDSNVEKLIFPENYSHARTVMNALLALSRITAIMIAPNIYMLCVEYCYQCLLLLRIMQLGLHYA